ncbi:MAG: hypothetical protein JW863_20285 [Chitinispirillaceae bacterium]|nr:hypothetical protein [Chitinispirillaceae bacterium]
MNRFLNHAVTRLQMFSLRCLAGSFPVVQIVDWFYRTVTNVLFNKEFRGMLCPVAISSGRTVFWNQVSTHR